MILLKQSATDALKTALKRAIQKTAEPTGDLIVNKNSDKITKVSKTSRQNNSESVECKIKTSKEEYIPPEIRQLINDDLRLF